MKAFRLVGLCALVLCTTSSAQAGEYAADFIHLGTGAAAQGMGGAWGTSKASATSFYWNPALVLDEEPFKLYFEGVTLFDGLSSYQTAACQIRLKEFWALSLGLQHQSVEDIPRFSDLSDGRDLSDPNERSSGLPLGYFGSNATAITAGISREFWFDIMLGSGLIRNRLPARLAVGASMRLIDERIDNATGTGQGVDLGFKLMIGEPVTAGHFGRREFILAIARQNLLAGDITWDTSSGHKDTLPSNTKVGISYLTDFAQWKTGVRTALEHDSAYDGTWHAGVEIDYKQSLFLRSGLVGSTFSDADPTLGGGLHFQHLVVDYAFNMHDLGLTHRVSVEFHF